MPITSESIPRTRKLLLFFIIDTSYYMEGATMGALNNAVEEFLPMLGNILKDSNDVEIEIAVLQFSSSVDWMYSNPISVENFRWRTLTVHSETDFGAVCAELTSKLTTTEEGGFMSRTIY